MIERLQLHHYASERKDCLLLLHYLVDPASETLFLVIFVLDSKIGFEYTLINTKIMVTNIRSTTIAFSFFELQSFHVKT